VRTSLIKVGYHNLIYFHEVGKGGHFAAWEQPDLFAAEIRAGIPVTVLGQRRTAPTMTPDRDSGADSLGYASEFSGLPKAAIPWLAAKSGTLTGSPEAAEAMLA
jgi:hypothetical protein